MAARVFPTKVITLDVANNQALNVARSPAAAARQDSQDFLLSRPGSPYLNFALQTCNQQTFQRLTAPFE
jgi:hypothetical protein